MLSVWFVGSHPKRASDVLIAASRIDKPNKWVRLLFPTLLVDINVTYENDVISQITLYMILVWLKIAVGFLVWNMLEITLSMWNIRVVLK